VDDLVHRPELFESRSWLVIGNYKPLAIELEAAPRDNREELGRKMHATPIEILQPAKRTGRTGRRPPRVVYASLRQAMEAEGRWVRTSIEGKPTQRGKARKVDQ
jgi:hypothetical protein